MTLLPSAVPLGLNSIVPALSLSVAPLPQTQSVQHQPERTQLDLSLQQRAVAAEYLLDVAEAARQRDRAARIAGVALGQRAALAPGLRRGRPVGAVVEEEQDVRRGQRAAGAGVEVDVLGLRRRRAEHAEADDRRRDSAGDAPVNGACLVRSSSEPPGGVESVAAAGQAGDVGSHLHPLDHAGGGVEQLARPPPAPAPRKGRCRSWSRRSASRSRPDRRSSGRCCCRRRSRRRRPGRRS